MKTLTKAFGHHSTPLPRFVTCDQWIANNLVASLTSIFRQRSNPTKNITSNQNQKIKLSNLLISLHTAARVRRPYQRSTVHPIVTRHRQNTVLRQYRFTTANLLASRCRLAPRSTFLTQSTRHSGQRMRINARVHGLRTDIRLILHVLEGTVRDRLQGTAIDVLAEWRIACPLAIVAASMGGFAAE